MQNFPKALWFILFLTVRFSAFCQVYQFENYTTRDGLVSDEVYSMRQDRKGYLWLFTNFGAQKYNGISFSRVLKNLPLSESFIYSSCESKNGRMWVANSMANIYEVKNDSAFLVKGLDSVSAFLREKVAEISELCVDDSLNIYVITKLYSYRLHVGRKGFSIVNLHSLYSTDSASSRVLQIKNQFIPAYVKIKDFHYLEQDSVALLISKPRSNQIFYIKAKSVGTPAHFKEMNNVIYSSFERKIIKINADQRVSYLMFKSRVQNYTLDKKGHLWVGCLNDGLYEFGPNDSLIGHYLENMTINHLVLDSQQGLWASTAGAGLFHCTNLNTLFFEDKELNGKPISVIRPLGKDLVVGTTRGDIFSMANGRPQLLHFSDFQDGALDVVQINNSFLISTLYHVEGTERNPATGTKGLLIEGYQTYARKMHLLSPDTLLCVLRKGLTFFVKGEFKRKIIFNSKIFDCVKWNGSLFVCAESGIYRVEKDSIVKPSFLNPASNIEITGVATDPHGSLWFYTQGYGVFRLDETNRLTRLTSDKILPSDIINNIHFATDNKILLSTNKGLYISNYSGDPALLSWKCIFPEAVTNALTYNNKIYLQTRGRLGVMDFYATSEEPVYYLNFAGVSINSQRTDTSKLRSLAHNENTIQFDLDLISFTRVPPPVSYNLEGPFSDEGISATHDLKFGNLPPGDYKLTVIPIVKNGNEMRLVIPFSIHAAFYQTANFKVAFVLCIAALMTFCVWLVFRKRRKKQDVRTTALRLILEYKLIALKAQINPHFMSNCLASIQNLIISNKVLQATDYISKFGLLVRQILNFSTRSLISVKEEVEIALLYLELEQMRFQNGFNFKVTVEDNVDIAKLFIPALILNPIIENAVWHGMTSLKEGQSGEVNIRVYRNGNRLLLSVSDNGSGIVSNKSPISNTRESKGLGLVQQRLRNINSLYDIDSATLSFETATQQVGTTVVISLPDNLEPLNNA